MQNEYRILKTRISTLTAAMAKLTKIAVKLNFPIPTLEIISEEIETLKNGKIKVWANIVLTACQPIIAGWQFVGLLQHVEGQTIVRTLPNILFPESYRTRNGDCDHCHVNRYRTDTYILQNVGTKEFKQVGSSCLKDFTGHANLHNIAEYLTFGSLCDEATKEESEFFGYGGNFDGYSIEKIIYWTSGVVSNIGWMSRAKSAENGKMATADIVASLFRIDMTQEDRDFRAKCTPTLAQESKGNEALAWAMSLQESDCTNDYLHNIRIVASLHYVKANMFGLACSIIAAYNNHIAREEAKANKPQKAESQFIGEVKQKISLTATYTKSFAFDGQYGTTYFHMFQDTNGNRLKWSSATCLDDLNEGQIVTLSGTVKSHETYRDIKQTCVTRCKVAGQ